MTIAAPEPGMTRAPDESPRITRSQLLGLARAGRPWAFLALGVRALESHPDDAELRFLTAANFARLGLRTPANECLSELPESLRTDTNVSALRHALGTLPPDEITLAERTALLDTNLAALGDGAPDLSSARRDWTDRAAAQRCFRALDGQVVRRRANDGRASAWIGLFDARGEGERIAKRARGDGRDAPLLPHTIEGIDPPWIFQQVVAALRPTAMGQVAAVHLVERDPASALDGLSMIDLRDELREPRVRAFLGPAAPDELAAYLRSRTHTAVVGPYISTSPVRAGLRPSIPALLGEIEREQGREHERLAERVRTIYAERDRAWWRRRYEEAARAGSGLRVLIPTSRFSTYIRHAAEDLAASLRAMGHDARVLAEPDDAGFLNTIAYLREFAAFEPDLAIVINYTRDNLAKMFGDALPATVPFVCWVQDAMPQLFSGESGRGQGELDFLVGHLHPELFKNYGYPEQRALAFPVVTSAAKFHPGPANTAASRHLECEIAYVSHHSETPDDMHARLCRETQEPALVRVFERLCPTVRELAENPTRDFLTSAIRPAIAEAVRDERYRDSSAHHASTLIFKLYAVPLAERIVRHQTLEWAAEAADRRGWRLHLYGRGWEKHPFFSRFARGELSHDEQLRSCYRSATVHLHASVHALMHQRVAECVLSGGFPMLRLNREELAALHWSGVGPLFARNVPPDGVDPETGRPGFAAVNHPSLLRVVRLLQELGQPASEMVTYDPARRAKFVATGASLSPTAQAVWMLGDAPEQFFCDREQFETRLVFAIENPDWRRAQTAFAAERVRRWMTHEAFVPSVLDLIRNGLTKVDRAA